jgi:hypothetical protein
VPPPAALTLVAKTLYFDEDWTLKNQTLLAAAAALMLTIASGVWATATAAALTMVASIMAIALWHMRSRRKRSCVELRADGTSITVTTCAGKSAALLRQIRAIELEDNQLRILTDVGPITLFACPLVNAEAVELIVQLRKFLISAGWDPPESRSAEYS